MIPLEKYIFYKEFSKLQIISHNLWKLAKTYFIFIKTIKPFVKTQNKLFIT
jgi:hypothetical protein